MLSEPEISERYYSIKQLYVIFNKNKDSMMYWMRKQKTFPKPIKLGRFSYYDKKEIFEFKKKEILFGDRAGEIDNYNSNSSIAFTNLAKSIVEDLTKEPLLIDDFNK